MTQNPSQGAAVSAAPRLTGRRRNAAEDQAAREALGCEVCHEWFPHQMLDWHHLEPHTRPDRRATHDRSRAAMHAEWEKCIVVCKNCHAIADYERDQ